jgi:hypothetical protein
MIHNKFIGILFIVAFLITFFLIGGARADDQKLVVPSPMEIRDYEPQPNQLMIVTYANERVFIYRIEKIIPKPDCNQVKFDEHRRIRITTQAVSQAYEYVLEPMPIMVSEWVRYDN